MAVSLYLSITNNATISPGSTLVFNNIVYNTGGISYNTLTGQIAFTQTGVYHINWWAATQDSAAASGVILSLIPSVGVDFKGDTPIKTGVLTGIGVLNVVSAPASFTLMNLTSGNVQLTNTVPVKGMLSVIKEYSDADVPGTMLDFEYQQLANVLAQIITLYPAATVRVYAPGLYDIDGTPQALYTSPQAAYPGIFEQLLAGQTESSALNTITAFRTGTGTVYNEDITYLAPPSPLPQGWSTDVITAIYDYLEVGDNIEIYWGIGNNTTGYVYKNEYGMLVVTADMDGNSPYFILPTSSLIIVTPPTDAKSSGKLVKLISDDDTLEK